MWLLPDQVLNLKQKFQLSRFIKGEKTDTNRITLNQRRIFILPSKRGLGFAVLIVLLLLIAFVYNNNLAYYLTFLLASVFFITIIHTFRSLAGLVLSCGQCHSVFAGEAAGFDISIDNPGKAKRFNLQINLDNQLNFILQPEEKKRVTVYSATKKRGIHPFETATLSSTYPLGLFRAWSPLRFNANAIIYPKPYRIELPFPETEGEQTQSFQNATQKKGIEDFSGLNEYQSGDSIKKIHWKAFAKGHGLFTKQYSGALLTELWLTYDQTPGQNLEERLSQLCRWVIEAEKAGLQYGFNIPGFKLDPAQGKVHYQQCLEALALF